MAASLCLASAKTYGILQKPCHSRRAEKGPDCIDFLIKCAANALQQELVKFAICKAVSEWHDVFMQNKKPPPLAIIGYGRMGHAVQQAAESRALAVAYIIRNRAELEQTKFPTGTVAICFTNPQEEADNIRLLASRGISMVIGTTGWHAQLPDLADFIPRYHVGLLHATNFSLGVQLTMRLMADAARMLHRFENYDVLLHEWHHKDKKDAPSGTAISMAEQIIKQFPRKKKWVLPPADRALQPDELSISAARGGTAVGYHAALFDSPGDLITVTHTSKGRAAYADGAITAALWLQGRIGVYTIDDLLQEMLP